MIRTEKSVLNGMQRVADGKPRAQVDTPGIGQTGRHPTLGCDAWIL
jgi:hypothetical protein